jgi:hypothetical protein
MDDAVPSLQCFIARPTRYRYFSGRVACEARNGWLRAEHALAACPRGFRRAVVVLQGRRAPNSPFFSPVPRFGGAKFAAAELVFA